MAQAYVKVKGTLVPLTSAKQHCHVWIGTKLAYEQTSDNLPNNILVIFKEELGEVVPDPTFQTKSTTVTCDIVNGEFSGWFKTLKTLDSISVNDEVGMTENIYYFDATHKLDEEPLDGEYIKIVTGVRDGNTGKVKVKWYNKLTSTPSFTLNFDEYVVDEEDYDIEPEIEPIEEEPTRTSYTVEWFRNDDTLNCRAMQIPLNSIIGGYEPDYYRRGYTNIGYSPSGVTNIINLSKQIDKDYSLYAQWAQGYAKLIFDADTKILTCESHFDKEFDISFSTELENVTLSTQVGQNTAQFDYIRNIKTITIGGMLPKYVINMVFPSSGTIEYYLVDGDITDISPI